MTFASDDKILVGVDLSREAFIRPVLVKDGGGTFTALPDDQFVARQERLASTVTWKRVVFVLTPVPLSVSLFNQTNNSSYKIDKRKAESFLFPY